MTLKKKRKVLFHIGIEFLLLNVLFILVYIANFSVDTIVLEKVLVIKFLTVLNIAWASIIFLNANQNFYLDRKVKNSIRYNLINTFVFTGIIATLAIVFKLEYFNRTILILPILLFGLTNFIFFNLLFEYYRRVNLIQNNSNILFVGLTHSQYTSKQIISLLADGNRVTGYLGSRDPLLSDIQYLGNLKRLNYILNKFDIDELYINVSKLEDDQCANIISAADYHGKRVNIMLDDLGFGRQMKAKIESGIAVLRHRNTPLNELNNYLAKRFFDIIFSLSVLILLSPILLLISLLIYIDSRGPIIYAPMRKGEENSLFKCFKFRTMKDCDDPLNGKKSTQINDVRITRIGKFLRKFDLDELPQFYNVLIGNMSIVGPRPHRVHLQKDFRKSVNEYMVRSYVKPGITGWAQVNGWRGPTKTTIQKEERIKHDLWFIENWSFLLDIRIIFLTVFSSKTRKNAF